MDFELEKYGYSGEAENLIPLHESIHPQRQQRWRSAALFASMIVNLLMVLLYYNHTYELSTTCETPFAHLKYDKVTSYQKGSLYSGENGTLADQLWESINVNAGAIALSDEYVASHGLLPAQRFPRDQSKGLYYIEGFHDLHCLKLLRRSHIEYERALEQSVNPKHLVHCFDALRMRIMCQASDNLLYTSSIPHSTGHGQSQVCRDFDRLLEWALEPERNACFDIINGYNEPSGLERFVNCPPGSPYEPKIQAYVAKFGYSTKQHPDIQQDQ